MHFQVVTMPPSFFPFRAHHTLNSNTCCCSALISSYMLYANTVSHHGVLLGSVSRVGLMVGCFKNSLSVRTENNSNTPPCIISQPSYGHPANYLLRSIGMFACYLERTLLWEQTLLPGLYTWLQHVKITIYVLTGQLFRVFFHATYPFFHFTEQKSRTNPSPHLTSSCFPPNHPAPVPPVGQQPSGRPEEEKPLGVSQRDRGSTGAHLPPAGLRCSSNPTAGWHQPHRRVRPRPLPPDLRLLQPSLLVHLPGQGHHGGRQVQKSHLVIMVHLHPSWYCYCWYSYFCY